MMATILPAKILLCSAQNENITTLSPEQEEECFTSYPLDLANTTGTTNFTLSHIANRPFAFADRPWYLTQNFHDVRGVNETDLRRPGTQRTSTWLSIPDVSTGLEVCVFRVREQNGTASGDALNGCEGILEPSCIDAMMTAVGRDQDGECTMRNATAVTEACGEGNNVGFWQRKSSRP